MNFITEFPFPLSFILGVSTFLITIICGKMNGILGHLCEGPAFGMNAETSGSKITSVSL
jgi:hypothetical protein